ncbi:MFS transporter [Paraburkholderia sp. BCC1886]|uniref:MFS transporter n=1 Tax=Paraburkholderia sp. BCC1886 TaxID=2562670 RepID=UPI0011834DE2|nr:MFS transporter [Paraburkholderia sp. BCC1886]
MRLTAVDAGMRMLPVGIGYFLASFAAASILHRLGPRALTLGFAIQMLGLVVAIMAVSGILAGGFGAGLLIAGIGFGISMPSIIKAVISGIDQRHAGLASGIVMSSLQVGGAVGVAMVGGVFFSTLGSGVELSSYAHAFNVSTMCNVVLMALGGALSLRMPALRHAMKGR